MPNPERRPDPGVARIAQAMDADNGGGKPPPGAEGHRDAVKTDKESQLSKGVALDIITIVRDELNKNGCRLKNYYVDFTASGFDIADIEIDVKDQQRVIDIVKEAEPEVRHEFSKNPTKYAYMAANIEIARRVKEELGLDYRAYAGQKTGKILVSVNEPKEEMPLPPSQEPGLPAELIAGVEEPPAHDDSIEGYGPGDEMELPPGLGVGGGGPDELESMGLGPSEPKTGEQEIEEMPVEKTEEEKAEEEKKRMRPGMEF
jgi:hypothetical protein